VRTQGLNGPSVVEFRGVSKRYEGGDVGLDAATFSVARGEFVFLVGATGSGKSTVMRLLIKELEPSAGVIRVAGHDLTEMVGWTEQEYRALFTLCSTVMQQLRRLPQPVIARVQGLATAAGLEPPLPAPPLPLPQAASSPAAPTAAALARSRRRLIRFRAQ